MAFRNKIKNKFSSQERQTLDAKHNNILTMFNENKSRLPELENKLQLLNQQIDALQQTNANNIVVDLTIQRQLWALDDEKNLLQNEIDDIRNNTDETKYMLNTGKILNDYYRLLEQEKNHISADTLSHVIIPNTNQTNVPTDHTIFSQSNIPNQQTTQQTTQQTIQQNIQQTINQVSPTSVIVSSSDKKPGVDDTIQHGKRKNIIDWFSQTDTTDTTFQNVDTGKKKFIIQKKISSSRTKNNNIKCKNADIKPGEITNVIQPTNSLIKNASNASCGSENSGSGSSESDDKRHNFQIMNKDDIYDKYMKIIDKNYINVNNSKVEVFDVCTICKTEMHLNNNSGLLICPKCGSIENIIVDSDKPSFKEPPKEMTSFCYKRINHLNEFLAQFQAKETTDIHEDVYNEILVEIKKERINNMALITPDKMRALLKKIKKNDYYEHIPYIINQLNGLPAPVIAPEIEEIIRGMFKAIQLPFEKYCPHRRKNFLSYNYVMYKFFELLELDEYLDCFQLLKSRTKLHQQDLIWKNICNDLNWQYIKSL